MALARGIHYFEEAAKLYTVWDNTVYADDAALITLTTNTGKVGMTEAVYGLTRYLFIADGEKAYLINKNSPTSFQMVDNTSVLVVTVTNGGSGYGSAPDVTIAAPNIPAWQASYTYSLGAIVKNNSNVYLCVQAGESDAATGPDGSGNSITDNAALWRFVCTLANAQATATCTEVGGAVTEVTVTNIGYGYDAAPTVTFASGTAAAVATLNGFPTPHIPTPVFLDGYIFLAKRGTPDVYNSGLGDYDYWSPIDYLSVSQYPDSVIALARQNNQIAVLKEESLEFLYDAANAYGSPLARTTQAIVQVGAVTETTVDDHERKVFFVGRSNTGTVGVWILEGFKEQKISTEAVDRILDNEGAFITFADGYAVRAAGHFFYVLRLYSNRTLVYDVEEQFWHEWSSVESGVEGNFFGKYATTVGTLAVVQHATNGKTYSVSMTAYEDDTGPIKVLWTSIPVDMENTYRKWFQSLAFVGDQQTDTSNLTVKYSDDDYKSWSSGWTINLQDRAYIKRLGSARRRAFKLEHEANTPFRMEALEIVYSQGEH